jgi:putative DNA methylase
MSPYLQHVEEREASPSSDQHRRDSVLARLDPEKVSAAARHESRNREVHLPPLSTFRWWARRTGAVNDAVLAGALEALDREHLDVLDPFAGGGTIPLVALRAGCTIHAQDLNPWAAAGIRQMLSLPSPSVLLAAHELLGELAVPLLREAYATRMENGLPGTLAHTYRVAVGRCSACETEHRQFPYSMLTLCQRKERRQPEAILACPAGHVFEGRADRRMPCPFCSRQTDPSMLYTPRRCVTCPECGHQDRLSDRAAGKGWRWEVVLVQRTDGKRREFALPSPEELRQADKRWKPKLSLGLIPPGTETSVLLRHGYRDWADLYPRRQRAVTEALLDLASEASDEQDVVDALRMAIVGTTEFAGHLCRWDRFYLKCNDATAGHRFNFSTFVPEINVWGAGQVGRGTVSRRVRSMAKASQWVYDVLGRRPVVASLPPDPKDDGPAPDARVICGDSGLMAGPKERFDLVLTDPPYHDDVHYGELSLPFRAWAGLSLCDLEGEAATNHATGVNPDCASYASALERIFAACHPLLRRCGRLVFSYANHEPEAWVALFTALQGAGFFAVACVSVHSENETDFKKRDVAACNEDLLLELSPHPVDLPLRLIGNFGGNPFMVTVAELFARVGDLPEGWEVIAMTSLRDARAGVVDAVARGR